MSQAIVFLHHFLNIFSCNRRNTGSRTDLRKASGHDAKIGSKRGTSLGYRSNESTDVDSNSDPALSTSGSDTDDPSLQPRAQKSSYVRPPPGLSCPPGLELPAGDRYEPQKYCVHKASLPQNLESIIDKLTPEDAAIMRAAYSVRSTNRFPSRAHITEENTLSSNLQKLGNIDSKRVFMVRKIEKLGFSSPNILKAYFSKFGPIESVYVTPNVDKRKLDEDPQANLNIRPATIGFMVMEKAEDVVNIFEQGLEHTISDVCVSLTAYEHHIPDKEPRCGRRYPSYTNITEDNTLSSNLRKMREIDASRIFMVKKIKKLGLGSAQMLRTHFGQVGVVTDVFVTHKVDRRKIDYPNAKGYVRPSDIGFVVMEKAEDAAAIFQNGFEQTLYGVNINLSAYEHQIPTECIA